MRAKCGKEKRSVPARPGADAVPGERCEYSKACYSEEVQVQHTAPTCALACGNGSQDDPRDPSSCYFDEGGSVAVAVNVSGGYAAWARIKEATQENADSQIAAFDKLKDPRQGSRSFSPTKETKISGNVTGFKTGPCRKDEDQYAFECSNTLTLKVRKVPAKKVAPNIAAPASITSGDQQNVLNSGAHQSPELRTTTIPPQAAPVPRPAPFSNGATGSRSRTENARVTQPETQAHAVPTTATGVPVGE